MDGVSFGIGKNLYFNMPWTFKETLNENCSITKSSFGLADCTFKGCLEIILISNDTHAATSATHSSFDDNWETILLDEGLSIFVAFNWTGRTGDNGNTNFHSYMPEEN